MEIFNIALGYIESTVELKTRAMGLISKPPAIQKFPLAGKKILTCVAGGDISSWKWINLIKPYEDLPFSLNVEGNTYTITVKVKEPGAYQCVFISRGTTIRAMTVVQESNCKSFRIF